MDLNYYCNMEAEWSDYLWGCKQRGEEPKHKTLAQWIDAQEEEEERWIAKHDRKGV